MESQDNIRLLNGDCLEVMKSIPDDSIDLIFTDLPYGQTSCKWDCPIDLDLMWKEYMRIKKLHTPIFFTTTTKFGVNLIQSAPKKCYFRYDLVWVKSAPAGFLSAKKMPMRKHEMIYVFYEKLPLYDLSSHKHKFIKEYNTFDNKDGAYGVVKSQKGHPEPLYNPPLPTSIVKEPEPEPEEDKYCDEIVNDNIIKDTKHGTNTYNTETGRKKPLKHTGSGAFGGEGPCYEPPLPTSVVKELDEKYKNKGGLYSKVSRNGLLKAEPHYEPPLPTSIVKEEYGVGGSQEFFQEYNVKNGMKKGQGGERYEPPLPTSVVKEPEPQELSCETEILKEDGIYGKNTRVVPKGSLRTQPLYEPPLPTSVVKEAACGGDSEAKAEAEPEPEPESKTYKGIYSELPQTGKGKDAHSSQYDPPLPNSILEVKSQRTKHSTQKPVDLMKWVLKYYSKEGDIVLDNCMGSGSTGVACKEMNRRFIGIEKDKDIFKVAQERLSYI